MPKMKTNRTAYKKMRTNAKGKLKRAQAYVSHNTAKKSPKRRRRLRSGVWLDATNEMNAHGQLPYRKKSLR